MRKLLVASIVGVMLIAGATMAVAQTDDTDTTEGGVLGRVGGFIEDVLDGLVSDGTLTEDQADAVTDAFQAAHEERRTEREAIRAERREVATQVQEALEDGVITADELAELPDGPWSDADGPLAEALEDGQITQDELDELRSGRGFGFGPRGHHRGGFGSQAGDSDQAAETGA